MVFSRQEYWRGLPFPSLVDRVLSERSIMTHPSWVALHGMAHSFLELDKTVVHMISLISFLWLWFDCVDHSKLLKILKEMGIPDHLTSLLRNLYARQEATIRTRHGTTDWFQIGKGVHQGCVLSLCLFNFYAEYIMQNAVLDKSQAGIKVARRNSNNSGIQMIPL